MPSDVPDGDALLEAGLAALGRAEWEGARVRFQERLSEDAECAEAWEGLSTACYWLQDAAGLFEAREQAYQRYRARADHRSAARVAVSLAADSHEIRGEPAVAAGWLERARQLLEGTPPTVEHAWLREIEAHLALAIRNDTGAARAAAAEACEIAHDVGDLDHEMLARAIEGLALVASGEVRDGMRRLDAAAAAALGGDMVDLVAIGVTCCYVIQACERVRDVERASEWCSRFESMCSRLGLGKFQTFCYLQHGTVLLWRGDWAAAEAELTAARRDLEEVRPAARAAALARLGELRRRQGRWEEAGELLNEARAHRLAGPWRSALALDEGDALSAEDLAEQALRNFPASDANRATPLELLVRARAARGATEEAALALVELESLAALIGTEAVRASALFAAGVLGRARGESEEARRSFQDAAMLFEAAVLPLETAMARLELARVLFEQERPEAAEAQAQSALGAFEALGAARHAGWARQLLGAGAESGTDVEGPDHPLTPRQREVLGLVAQGLANREIAGRLSLSEFTVRRHLSNIYVRLEVSSRAAAVARALREGLV